jgi:hypothetical protein
MLRKNGGGRGGLEILERMHGFLLFVFNRSPENPAAMTARVIHFIPLGWTIYSHTRMD